MDGEKGQSQKYGIAPRLAVVGLAAFLASTYAMPPALAQFGDFDRRGGFFGSFFDPFSGPRYERRPRHEPRPRYRAPERQLERQVDYSRAPAPRKFDTQPSNLVLVLGDSMADWLAYGLEDALSDSSEIGVVRKPRAGSGLVRSDAHNEAKDWAQLAREAITVTKPKFIVMMVGLNDRQAIRLRMPPDSRTPSGNNVRSTAQAEDSASERPGVATQPRGPLQTYEFRSELWAEQYSKHIDITIAALKSSGVPVFWVGLPSIRGPKSTADMLYLNELFRSRAEKAGISYIDVWDGFVDQNDHYTAHGPDFQGQTRQLRAGDGVHFTKAGARKLAHYVEREIRRAMTQGVTAVAVPASEPPLEGPVVRPGMPAPRPLAGPVLALTATPRGQEELVGDDAASPPERQPLAQRVLEKGEAITPPAGRSDDLTWPRRQIAPFGTDPAVVTTTDPVSVVQAAPAAIVSVSEQKSRTVTTVKQTPRRTTKRAPQPAEPRSSFSIFPFFR
jgi:hypothetical protein